MAALSRGCKLKVPVSGGHLNVTRTPLNCGTLYYFQGESPFCCQRVSWRIVLGWPWKKKTCKRLTCFSQWIQKDDKDFFSLLSYVISYTVKTLRLSHLLGHWVGGGGGVIRAFGGLCVRPKKSWLRPCPCTFCQYFATGEANSKSSTFARNSKWYVTHTNDLFAWLDHVITVQFC